VTRASSEKPRVPVSNVEPPGRGAQIAVSTPDVIVTGSAELLGTANNQHSPANATSREVRVMEISFRFRRQ
jgi:hypothetical protein